MVSQRNDGLHQILGIIPEDLAERASDAIESNEELSDSRLVREGLREVLPEYE